MTALFAMALLGAPMTDYLQTTAATLSFTLLSSATLVIESHDLGDAVAYVATYTENNGEDSRHEVVETFAMNGEQAPMFSSHERLAVVRKFHDGRSVRQALAMLVLK